MHENSFEEYVKPFRFLPSEFFVTLLNLCSFQYIASKQTTVPLKSSQQVISYVIHVFLFGRGKDHL